MSTQTSKQERDKSFRAPAELHRDLYCEIFKHSSEPIAIIDPQGFYLEQNAAHAQLLGYTDEELQNQTPALHMGAEAFAEVVRAVAEKGDYRCEVLSKTKSGEIKHIELSAFAMRDGSGEPICYVGIKRDISERKQAEQALQRSEAELTDFFENAAVALTGWAPTGSLCASIKLSWTCLATRATSMWAGISRSFMRTKMSLKISSRDSTLEKYCKTTRRG
jgi:PAS domain S-box-containing protein